MVINADSMQVYRDLRILTARPGHEDQGRVPHRLYGVLPGICRCSVGRWRDLALAEIAAAEAAGRIPVLVGGTGLYLEALTEGIADIPPVPEPIRAAMLAWCRADGSEALHTALVARDPATATRLKPGDTQRLVRAWEVLEATGRSLTDWQADIVKPSAHLQFTRILLLPHRQTVYAACDRRFLAMIEAGAVGEVEALRSQGLDPALPVMKAIGVPELSAYLDGRLSLNDAVVQAQTASRHYAKRQITWFQNRFQRHASMLAPPFVLETQYCKSFLPKILMKFRL